MPQALSPTALAITASELVQVTSARCRAMVERVVIEFSLFRDPWIARFWARAEDAPASWGHAGSPRSGLLSGGCTAGLFSETNPSARIEHPDHPQLDSMSRNLCASNR